MSNAASSTYDVTSVSPTYRSLRYATSIVRSNCHAIICPLRSLLQLFANCQRSLQEPRVHCHWLSQVRVARRAATAAVATMIVVSFVVVVKSC